MSGMITRALSLLALLVAPASGLNIGRRACLLGCIGAGASGVPKPAAASYAMGVAAVQQQSWTPTGKEAEKKVYDSIEQNLDLKRRYRDASSEASLGDEYTNYRRGAGRDEWEAKKNAGDSGSTDLSKYMSAEEMIVMKQARRALQP